MTGYTETTLGRRRYLPDLTSDNRQRREMAERMALNAPIQGSAADVIKVAMLNVEKAIAAEGLRSRMLLQVHDELVLEVAPGEREPLEALVRREMAGAADLSVPLEVSVGFGAQLGRRRPLRAHSRWPASTRLGVRARIRARTAAMSGCVGEVPVVRCSASPVGRSRGLRSAGRRPAGSAARRTWRPGPQRAVDAASGSAHGPTADECAAGRRRSSSRPARRGWAPQTAQRSGARQRWTSVRRPCIVGRARSTAGAEDRLTARVAAAASATCGPVQPRCSSEASRRQRRPGPARLEDAAGRRSRRSRPGEPRGRVRAVQNSAARWHVVRTPEDDDADGQARDAWAPPSGEASRGTGRHRADQLRSEDERAGSGRQRGGPLAPVLRWNPASTSRLDQVARAARPAPTTRAHPVDDRAVALDAGRCPVAVGARRTARGRLSARRRPGEVLRVAGAGSGSAHAAVHRRRRSAAGAATRISVPGSARRAGTTGPSPACGPASTPARPGPRAPDRRRRRPAPSRRPCGGARRRRCARASSVST